MSALLLVGCPVGAVRLTPAAGAFVLPLSGVPDGILVEGELLAEVPMELGQARIGATSPMIPLGRRETTAMLLAKAEMLAYALGPLRLAIVGLSAIDLNHGQVMPAALAGVAVLVAFAERNLPRQIDRELIHLLLHLNEGIIRGDSLRYFKSVACRAKPMVGAAFCAATATQQHTLTVATVGIFVLQVGGGDVLGFQRADIVSAACGLVEDRAAVANLNWSPARTTATPSDRAAPVLVVGYEIWAHRALRSLLGISGVSPLLVPPFRNGS